MKCCTRCKTIKQFKLFVKDKRKLKGIGAICLACEKERSRQRRLENKVKDKFYKKRSTDSNLKRFTTIAIKSIDMVSILAGRIPIYKHKDATVIKNGLGDGYVLVLKKRWGNILEKIYLDENKENVQEVELFGQNGVLAYRAKFSEMRDVEGYQIPFRLYFSNGDGLAFQLDIDRYWADVSVSPSVFEMASPEQ